MKEKLHQAERAQLNFAAAASHELRTPLHQINAAAALLRQSLQHALTASPAGSPSLAKDDAGPPGVPAEGGGRPDRPPFGAEDKADAMAHLDMIETNGEALGQILENIIDTLDIGRLSANLEETIAMGKQNAAGLSVTGPGQAELANAAAAASVPGAIPRGLVNGDEKVNLADLLEGVIKDMISMENKARRLASAPSLNGVEIILEVMPRLRGRWLMASNPGPLIR
jgi:signal transduction histidine kinase